MTRQEIVRRTLFVAALVSSVALLLVAVSASPLAEPVARVVIWTAQFGESGGDGPTAGRLREDEGRDHPTKPPSSTATPVASPVTRSEAPTQPSAAELTRARRLTPASAFVTPSSTDDDHRRGDRDRDDRDGATGEIDLDHGVPVALRYAGILALFVVVLYAIPSARSRSRMRRSRMQDAETNPPNRST